MLGGRHIGKEAVRSCRDSICETVTARKLEWLWSLEREESKKIIAKRITLESGRLLDRKKKTAEQLVILFDLYNPSFDRSIIVNY